MGLIVKLMSLAMELMLVLMPEPGPIVTGTSYFSFMVFCLMIRPSMVLYIKKCPSGAWAGERVLLEKGYGITVFCVMIRNALRHYVVLCCNIL